MPKKPAAKTSNRQENYVYESALLSFCQQSPHFGFHSERSLPEGNKNGGKNRFRLHPIYVPTKFTERLGHKPITEDQLNALFAKVGGKPLFVYIGPDDKNFQDSTRKYDPGEPPSDEAVRERIRQYWPLQRAMKRAALGGDGFPNVLIAVSGTKKFRVIIAATEIARGRTGTWKHKLIESRDGKKK